MKNTKQQNIADEFYKDLVSFREKYPMVYVEIWTPDDFIEASQDEDQRLSHGGDEGKPVDWNDPLHEITASNLFDNFDANVGTNWDRVRYESVS